MIKLLRDEIIKVSAINVMAADQVLAGGLEEKDPIVQEMAKFTGNTAALELSKLYQNAVDYTVVSTVAEEGQTIIFDSRQALALRPAMQRLANRPFWKLPFPSVILQFTEPIAETDFFQVEPSWRDDDPDPVLALILAQHEETRNAIAYYKSTNVQRVKWIEGNPTSMMDLINPDDPPTPEAWHNKQQLQLLAQACAMYLACENIEIQRHTGFKRHERRQAERNGEELPVYHEVVTRVAKYHYKDVAQQIADEANAAEHKRGTPHGYRYDVSWHFRELTDGRVIIVKSHERGVRHPPETKKQAVKRVPYTPQDPRLKGSL